MRFNISKSLELTDQGSRGYDESTTTPMNTISGNGEMIERGEVARPLSSQSPVALSVLANAAPIVVDSTASASESSAALPLAPPRVYVSSENTSTAIQPNLTITPIQTINAMSSNNPSIMSRHPSMFSTTGSLRDPAPQTTLDSPFHYDRPISRRKNILVQSVLAMFLIGTIVAYICVWKFEETKQTYLHIIFIFLIVAEISIWERWYTAQRMRSEWDSTFIDPPNSAARLWAPWNDPDLQQRIAERQSRNADVFDPECPADFIPPPAYGNVRDSVLIDPNTGRALAASTQAVAATPPGYDAISLSSLRRSTTHTLEQRPERINAISTNSRQSRFSVLPFKQRLTNDLGEGSSRAEPISSLPLRRSDSVPITHNPPRAAGLRRSSTGPKKVISGQHASVASCPGSHQNQAARLSD